MGGSSWLLISSPALSHNICNAYFFHLQVARAGRFGTEGLAITFVSDDNDDTVLNSVQDRFDVTISELPDEIDVGLRYRC